MLESGSNRRHVDFASTGSQLSQDTSVKSLLSRAITLPFSYSQPMKISAREQRATGNSVEIQREDIRASPSITQLRKLRSFLLPSISHCDAFLCSTSVFFYVPRYSHGQL